MKILFVCECNICRSPMAEFIFRHMMSEYPDTEIASAGISGERAGADIYPMAKECLSAHSIPFESRHAVVLKITDYFKYDLIICMDEWTKYNTKVKCLQDPEHKIYKLLEFAERNTEGLTGDDLIVATDIFDPHQDKNFERAYDEIYEGCAGLKNHCVNTLG